MGVVTVIENNAPIGVGFLHDDHDRAFVCDSCGELWLRLAHLDEKARKIRVRSKPCFRCHEDDYVLDVDPCSPLFSTLESLVPDINLLTRDFLWLTQQHGE
jgi:hypothetical protein